MSFFQCKLLHPDAVLPTRSTPGAVGYDVASVVDLVIPPRTTVPVPLGIAILAPPGVYMRITNRSSLAVRSNLVVNADVADSDYTGPLHAVVYNPNKNPYHVH